MKVRHEFQGRAIGRRIFALSCGHVFIERRFGSHDPVMRSEPVSRWKQSRALMRDVVGCAPLAIWIVGR